MAADTDSHWHLDKKVPITLIFVLLAQLATGLWFAGRTVERDDAQEKRLSAIEQDRKGDAVERQNVSGRISVLESRVYDVKEALDKANQKLDRLIEKGSRP